MNLTKIKSWAAYGVGFAAVYIVAKLFHVPVEMHDGHVDIERRGKKAKDTEAVTKDEKLT